MIHYTINENQKEKTKMSEIRKLVDELERQKQSKYDVVVSSDNLIVFSDGNTIKMDVTFQNSDGLNINKKHPLTDWAHSQVAEKTGIPMKYYRRMQDEGKLDLLSQNINTWLPTKEQRLVRVLDGQVRALLSDGYYPIDNYDVLFSTLEEVKKVKEQFGINIDVKQARITDTKMYIKFTSPDLSDEIMKFRDGRTEPVEGGIIISNSEVGNGAFSVSPFINVLVCSNGLVSDNKLRRVHIGRKLDAGVINWSGKTRQLEDEVLFSKIKDMINQTFNPDIFHKWVDEINGVATTEVPKPSIAIDNIISHFEMPKSKKDDLLNEFTNNAPETGNTQWGISMAVTRLAQKEENYEDQIKMEEIGAKILDRKLTPILLKDEE